LGEAGAATESGGEWQAGARLALDALAMKPARGIPSWMIHLMDAADLEHFAGRAPGDYRRDVEGVYLDFQRRIGTCFIDQYIPDNPLSMTAGGLGPDAARGPTTGAPEAVLDGMPIRSPEDVVAHLERHVFPRLEREAAACDPADAAARAALVEGERAVQRRFSPGLLKVPYAGGFGAMPCLRYYEYGYANYFMAFALWPEVMERDFALQADLAARTNALAARAILDGGLPRVVRLDHDMADSRGTLVDVRALDRLWFPHFARSIAPLLEAGVRLLWHCDGNLMAMVPRLLEAGVGGFQGFQYEDGMDYARICRMTDRAGGPLMIWAGVSVTRTLPRGTPADVAAELAWLVRHGPPVGLCLGASSSVLPGVPRENLRALFDGLRHYREGGRP